MRNWSFSRRKRASSAVVEAGVAAGAPWAARNHERNVCGRSQGHEQLGYVAYLAR